MATIYEIRNGETTLSQPMSRSFEGTIVQLLFFDGAGAQVTPTGAKPTVSRDNGAGWRAVNPMNANEWAFNGPCINVLISLAGVTGYSTYKAIVWRSDDPIDLTPEGLYSGLRAITVQPYTEANVKNGVQFDLRASWRLGDVIPTGASRKIRFTTGAKTVLIKLREFQFIAEEMTLRLFRAPTITGAGAALSINNYNARNPVATTVSAAKNVITSDDGIEFNAADAEVFFGSQNNPQRVQSVALQGRERILLPNTVYLVVITNTGTGDARAEYHLDWYEGDTDLPI